MRNIDSIKNIRSYLLDKSHNIEAKPGTYRWWFQEEGIREIINQLPGININMIQKRNINGKSYWALYFGISKNLEERIKWHICQHHTASSITSGFLSTLRQTLSALLKIDMTKSEEAVNKLIDENCYLEWDYTETHQDAIDLEKQELSSNTYYYPLNITNNQSTPKNIINSVKKLRKQYNK